MKSSNIIESKDAQRDLQCTALSAVIETIDKFFFFQTVDNCIQFRCKMQGGYYARKFQKSKNPEG